MCAEKRVHGDMENACEERIGGHVCVWAEKRVHGDDHEEHACEARIGVDLARAAPIRSVSLASLIRRFQPHCL